jgi:hypothetical protein
MVAASLACRSYHQGIAGEASHPPAIKSRLNPARYPQGGIFRKSVSPDTAAPGELAAATSRRPRLAVDWSVSGYYLGTLQAFRAGP